MPRSHLKITPTMLRHRPCMTWTCLGLLFVALGCGTTREKLATEQLLLSDAVDRAVARIDFTPLAGQTVYLDPQYLRQMKVTSVVNADYIISSLRQQMVLAGCLPQDNRDEAEFVAEPRVGVLGSDAHDVNYGLPSSQGIHQAASLMGAAALPILPEISFARRTNDAAAAKVAVFAYRRKTKEPVWQSGTSMARSTSQAKWILGAGPFESGTIFEGTQFAGGGKTTSHVRGTTPEESTAEDAVYQSPALWDRQLQEKLLGPAIAGTSSSEEAAQETKSPAKLDTPPAATPLAAATPIPGAPTAAPATANTDKANPPAVQQAQFTTPVTPPAP